MPAEIIVLVLTLLVALAGISPTVQQHFGGPWLVAVLLIIGTGLSIFLKFRDAKETQQLRHRVQQLLEASRPADNFIKLVDNRFQEIRQQNVADVSDSDLFLQAVTNTSDGVRCSWFWLRERRILLGLWTLSEDEMSELQLAGSSKEQLGRALESILFKPWTDEKAVPAKVSSCIEAWLQTRYNKEVSGSRIEWLFLGVPTSTIYLQLRTGKTITAKLALTPDVMQALTHTPPYECGRIVAAKVDAWLESTAAPSSPGQVEYDLRSVFGGLSEADVSEQAAGRLPER